MILLLTKEEKERENILKRKFRRYNVNIIKTGIDLIDLKLLIDIYLGPEFKDHKEKENNE